LLVVIIIFIIYFSNHNIDAHSNTTAVPLIVVTNEKADTKSSSTRLVHQLPRVDKTTKSSYSSIIPFNMDNISLRGMRRNKNI
jgi:hypothetical protein